MTPTSQPAVPTAAPETPAPLATIAPTPANIVTPSPLGESECTVCCCTFCRPDWGEDVASPCKLAPMHRKLSMYVVLYALAESFLASPVAQAPPSSVPTIAPAQGDLATPSPFRREQGPLILIRPSQCKFNLTVWLADAPAVVNAHSFFVNGHVLLGSCYLSSIPPVLASPPPTIMPAPGNLATLSPSGGSKCVPVDSRWRSRGPD